MTDSDQATRTVAPTLAHLAVPIASLCPHPRNPRRGDLEAVKDSLRHHGQYRPIVATSGRARSWPETTSTGPRATSAGRRSPRPSSTSLTKRPPSSCSSTTAPQTSPATTTSCSSSCSGARRPVGDGLRRGGARRPPRGGRPAAPRGGGAPSAPARAEDPPRRPLPPGRASPPVRRCHRRHSPRAPDGRRRGSASVDRPSLRRRLRGIRPPPA